MSNHPTHHPGSAILEVLIAATVMALVVTAIAAAMTYSLRGASEARFREAGVSFGQNMIELLRRERKFLGWPAFLAALQPGTYCVNALDTLTLTHITGVPPLAGNYSGNCTDFVDTGYKVGFRRTLVITHDASSTPPTIKATVTIEWQDGTRTPEVILYQEFRKWDE